MKGNKAVQSNYNKINSNDSSRLLSLDSEKDNAGAIILGALGSALWELAKGAWSAATDTNGVDIKDLVDFEVFVSSMSNKSQKTLQSLLKNGEELSDSVKRAEKNNNPKLAREYRSQLADTYEQMSAIVSQESYRLAETRPNQVNYARKFARQLLDISEIVRTPGTPIPNLDIRDLRQSKSNLKQNNLVESPKLGNSTQSNINPSQNNQISTEQVNQSYQQLNGKTTTIVNGNKSSALESQNFTTQKTDSKTDVSKVVTLLKDNAAEVKRQSGLDVNTDEGLGKAVMIYWKEHNLDPKTLKEQLPNMKGSDVDAALASVTETKTVETTKTKQVEAQRQ
jgi:hypothetical protein